jgi:hypothetical protein
MSNDTERRQWTLRASAIEHAVKLMRTHGVSYASMYLKNLKFPGDTIVRVLADDSSQRRTVWTQGQCYVASPDEKEREEGLTRQLSYTSRVKSGLHR